MRAGDPCGRPRTPRPSPPWRRGRCQRKWPRCPSEAKAPNKSTAVAPTLAPEETPSRKGSARALRTRTWTTVPAVVRAAPTTAASSTRGRRICQTISSATVFFGWPEQVIDDDLPHRRRAQGHRPDADPERHGDDEEHDAADEHDRIGKVGAVVALTTSGQDVGGSGVVGLHGMVDDGRAAPGTEGVGASPPSVHPLAARRCRPPWDHRRNEVCGETASPHEPPFLRGLFRRCRAGDRTRPRRGPPLRDSAGISPDFASSAPPRQISRAGSTYGSPVVHVKPADLSRYLRFMSCWSHASPSQGTTLAPCARHEQVCHAISGIGDPDHVASWSQRFALLGDPNRLALLFGIHHAGPISVTDLAVAANMRDTSVSQALRLLRANGVVSRRIGRGV